MVTDYEENDLRVSLYCFVLYVNMADYFNGRFDVCHRGCRINPSVSELGSDLPIGICRDGCDYLTVRLACGVIMAMMGRNAS